MRRQRIDEHLRLGLLTPHVRLIGRLFAAESERQSRQGFEDLRFAFIKGDPQLVVMQVRVLQFNFESGPLIELQRCFELTLTLRDLRR